MVETLGDAQIKRLFSVIGRRSEKGFRDCCILLVLLDTGVRLSELVNLQVRDLDLERGFFKVMGKGARERLVPFGGQGANCVLEVPAQVPIGAASPQHGDLFLKSSGMPLSYGQVYRRIRQFYASTNRSIASRSCCAEVKLAPLRVARESMLNQHSIWLSHEV